MSGVTWSRAFRAAVMAMVAAPAITGIALPPAAHGTVVDRDRDLSCTADGHANDRQDVRGSEYTWVTGQGTCSGADGATWTMEIVGLAPFLHGAGSVCVAEPSVAGVGDTVVVRFTRTGTGETVDVNQYWGLHRLQVPAVPARVALTTSLVHSGPVHSTAPGEDGEPPAGPQIGTVSLTVTGPARCNPPMPWEWGHATPIRILLDVDLPG